MTDCCINPLFLRFIFPLAAERMPDDMSGKVTNGSFRLAKRDVSCAYRSCFMLQKVSYRNVKDQVFEP